MAVSENSVETAGFWHRLRHLFRLQKGNPYTWWETEPDLDGKRLMVGFRCGACGDISGVGPSGVTADWP